MDIKFQYNKIGNDYLVGQHSFFSGREDWGRVKMVEFISPLAGKMVVDMGCGDGVDVECYLEQGAEMVYGIDPSSYMLEKAGERLPGCDDQLHLGDYEQIPLPNAVADIVTGRYSLHYLDDFTVAYQELARVLKKGGKLVLLVPHPVADYHLKRQPRPGLADLVSMPLYDGKVVVTYPLHQLSEYLSETFFEHFELTFFTEFTQEEAVFGETLPTAMVLGAVRR